MFDRIYFSFEENFRLNKEPDASLLGEEFEQYSCYKYRKHQRQRLSILAEFLCGRP